MKATEIKKQLHAQIDKIEDAVFLRELKMLLNARLGQSVSYEFSPDQLNAIAIGREQIEQGEGIPHDEVEADIQQWLDGK